MPCVEACHAGTRYRDTLPVRHTGCNQHRMHVTIAHGQISCPAGGILGVGAMASQKERPDNVPEENVYNNLHWMVILTYVVAIGGLSMLMMSAG